MSGTIAEAFRRARGEGRPAFIPYVTAGDPSLESTRAIVAALGRGGADLIELGVPFSDPIADGVVIQRAADRAIRGGATLEGILDLAARLRGDRLPPIVLFSYFNPILRMGSSKFARKAADAGVAGVLVTDLPPEEAEEMRATLAETGVARIGFLAPTTPPERVRAIARDSSGFLYLISRAGVTGARPDLPVGLDSHVAAIRAVAPGLPIAVGFGVSRPEQVRSLAAFADGVVVGSALVQVIEEAGESHDLPGRVERFCRTLLC